MNALETVENQLRDRRTGTVLQRRWRGGYEIDPWGLDTDLANLLDPVWGLRYSITVDRPERLPIEGPALVVANRRFGFSEPLVLARGVRLATGRHVRCVGLPDVDPVGPLMRRLGGVVARPDEIAGLLRAGEIVAVFLQRDILFRFRAGVVPTELFQPAFDLGVPVVPAAVLGREVGRSWRVRLAPSIHHPDGPGLERPGLSGGREPERPGCEAGLSGGRGSERPGLSGGRGSERPGLSGGRGSERPGLSGGRGPLAMSQLADRARDGVQDLLDEAQPAPRWI